MRARTSGKSHVLCLSVAVWLLAGRLWGAEVVPVRLEVQAEAKPGRVRFGDPLVIVVTLRNPGREPLAIRPGSVILVPSGWTAKGGGGTGLGLDIALASGKDPAGVPAGGSLALSGVDHELTVVSLGPMRASFKVRSSDDDVRKFLPEEAALTVLFEVAPSDFMSAAWRAKTAADRAKLLPETRELLRLRARAKSLRDRSFVQGILRYSAGYALPLLEEAFRDPDPVVRSQAIQAYHYGVWAVGNLNAILNAAGGREGRPNWAEGLEKGDERGPQETCERLATAGLKDADAGVRLAAVKVLTWRKAESALGQVSKLTVDPDPAVRSVAQEYLSLFASRGDVTETILASLSDADAKVQDEALAALEKSPRPPPLASLRPAFQSAKRPAALRLLALLVEQEDAALPSALLPGFAERSVEERLAILTALAGHVDEAAEELVKLGLRDSDPEVQRAALMRLLTFPKAVALRSLEESGERIPAALRELAGAVRGELTQRSLFPFLRAAEGHAAARESAFPSRNGTVPMVSPDGQWVAYVETGWGRPGGSGGMGRSNLLSLVHVVRADGTDDRIVSDMFLVGWLADSRRVGSARDGHAAISSLDGEIVAEFGQMLGPEWQKYADERANWRHREVRQQLGAQMPHRKRLADLAEMDCGEDAAFSPDGKRFGPLPGKDGAWIEDAEGRRTRISIPERQWVRGRQATWSPDGRYIALMGGKDALIVPAATGESHVIRGVDAFPRYESWSYRKCRWNPWAKDGSRLAFVRGGQVWVAAPDGGEAKQLTFDTAQKAWPTFSRDRKRVAYVVWQPDHRERYPRVGPTDVWVVDIAASLTVRATAPSPGRIHCLDWLNDHEVIFDRLEPGSGYASSLRRLDLDRPAEKGP